MKRLAWLTDIHLDFLENDEVVDFIDRVAAVEADAVLLTGDFSVAPKLGDHLGSIAARITSPVYFVLGNHDYYGASVDRVREAMRSIIEVAPKLRWLPRVGVVPLTPETALIGCDGWADAQVGNVETTPVRMNDFVHIADLRLGRSERLTKLRELGRAEAELARRLLAQVEAGFHRVVFATHVPPFAEACRYAGRQSSADFLPFLVCKAVGDELLSFADRRPDIEIMVLCGHTHGEAFVQLRDKLTVRVGSATYGSPRIADVIEVD